MGRTQPHGISGHHAAAAPPLFGVCPAYVSHTSPEKARAVTKAWLRSFAPDCGERTISAGMSPRFGSRFRGCRRSVSIGGEPVAIVACFLRSALWGAGLVQGSLSQCLIPQSVWGWGAGKVCVMDASFWFFRRYFATVFLLDSPTFAVTVFARVVLRGLL